MGRSIVEKTGTAAEIVAIGIAQTACPGAMYRSTDSEEVWFGGQDGRLIGPVQSTSLPKFYGDFPDDSTAGLNGVPIGGIYFLTPFNGYDMAGGLPKKRIEVP